MMLCTGCLCIILFIKGIFAGYDQVKPLAMGRMLVEHMDVLVHHATGRHLADCHLVLLTEDLQHTTVFSAIIRHVKEPAVVIRITSPLHTTIPRAMWGEGNTICRALVLHIGVINDAVLRLVDHAGLWKMPETCVVVLCKRRGMEAILLQPVFRNTIHGFYIALCEDYTTKKTHPQLRLKSNATKSSSHTVESKEMLVYHRCLYCEGGEVGVRFLGKIHTKAKREYHEEYLAAVRDQFLNFHGHEFKIVTVSYFPYIDYVKEKDEPGASVILSDSVDARILETLTHKLNFTYNIREEPERSWGRVTEGEFSGMMGQLQREESDICTMSSLTPERLQVIRHARAYVADILTLVSLKPSFLPQHLSVIRPFEWEVWVGVIISVVVCGFILWKLERVCCWAADKSNLHLQTALLYSWGALLAQPPRNPSVNNTGKVMVAAFLLFSLILTTGFRSSLIAHLTVKGKSSPIETFSDILSRRDWRWGIETWMLKGVPYDYLSNHHSPVVQKIYQDMDVLSAEEGISKVLSDSYTFITVKTHISAFVSSYYSNDQGITSIYISSKGVYTLPDYGWGFRRGAPFYPYFRFLLMRLDEAGITPHWMENVIEKRVKANRKMGGRSRKMATIRVEDGLSQAVLEIDHLQGPFYLLFLGFVIAFLTFLIEKLVSFKTHSYESRKQIHTPP